jgi:hypothetical protein
MIQSKFFLIPRGILLLGGMMVVGAVSGEEKPAPRPRDVGKGAIERPVKNVVARTLPEGTSASTPAANPKVEPGKIRWHPSFDAACKAARSSGKPVLLFHMMGKLDDQFC